MANRLKLNKFHLTIILIVIIPALIWVFSPFYLKKAIIHQFPGIYDYQIFHNRTIQNETPQIWPRSIYYNQFKPSDNQQDSITLMETTAFLVIQNDSVLYEYYPEEINDTEISNSFSMAKSIVSLLIGCAIEDGYIRDIHQPVEELLPDFHNLHGHGLTLYHLLTMSSASNWDEAYSSPFSVTTKAYYGKDLEQLMKRIEITDAPGKIFSYRSGDTQLLATILARQTGMSLSEYTSRKLWQPLGAENPAVWSLDQKTGMEKAYCCFNSHARDFARIGQLILNQGQWKNHQLVPEEFVKASIAPLTHLVDTDENVVDYYGYQWWILNHEGENIPYARGILGQYVFIIPSQNAVIVRLGHKRSKTYQGRHPVDAFTWINCGKYILNQN